MREWPQAAEVQEYLRVVRYEWRTDGWRTMAEVSGHFECPEFARLLDPLERLERSGVVECWTVNDDGPRLWRAA